MRCDRRRWDGTGRACDADAAATCDARLLENYVGRFLGWLWAFFLSAASKSPLAWDQYWTVGRPGRLHCMHIAPRPDATRKPCMVVGYDWVPSNFRRRIRPVALSLPKAILPRVGSLPFSSMSASVFQKPKPHFTTGGGPLINVSINLRFPTRRDMHAWWHTYTWRSTLCKTEQEVIFIQNHSSHLPIFFCLKIRAGVAQWHREPVPAVHYNIDENHQVFTKTDKGTVFVDSLKTGCFDFFKYKIKNWINWVKPEILVGLSFFIQNLNLEWKNGRKLIDKLKKLSGFSISPLRFQKLNCVPKND
jgi:hypothetical protein